jgi:hypothetical protein
MSEPNNYLYQSDISFSIATNQTNYQVQVILDNSNFNFNNVRNDGGDIRFFRSSTKLPYYQELWDLSNQKARFWIKVDLSGVSSLKMYYGDNTKTSESNGFNVFDFFDDFNVNNFSDLSQWQFLNSSDIIVSGNTIGYSLSNSKLIATNVDTGNLTKSIQEFSANTVLEVHHKMTSNRPTNGYTPGGFLNSFSLLLHSEWDYIWKGDWLNRISNSESIAINKPFIMRFFWNLDGSSELVLTDLSNNSYNTINTVSSIATTYTSNKPIMFGRRNDNQNFSQEFSAEWEWFRVRKFNDIEPTLYINNVVLDISINVQPQNTNVISYEYTSLSVGATGTPPLLYQWKKDGINILGATDSVYEIESAFDFIHDGSYNCVVSNSTGSITSDTVYLRVDQSSNENFDNLDADVSFNKYTLLETPEGAITNTSFNTIDISWNLISGATSYYIEYSLDNIDFDAFTDISDDNNILTISDLLPATQYYIRIKSVGPNNNDSEYSTVILTTTDSGTLYIDGIVLQNKIYDKTNTIDVSSFGFLVGVQPGHDVSLNVLTATASFDNVNVGVRSVTITNYTLTGANVNNYIFNEPSGLTAEIFVRPITITANNKSKQYGLDISFVSFDVSIDNIINTDTIDNIQFTSVDASTNVGIYNITPFGGTNSNYDITYIDGSINIFTAPLTITVDSNQSKVYGDDDTTFTYTESGLYSWDTFTDTLTRVEGNNVGFYDISNTLTINNLPITNYDVSFNGAQYEITPAPLYVKANDISSTYGDYPNIFTYDISGLKYSDIESITTQPDSGIDVSNYIIRNTVSITGSLPNSLDLSNYSLNNETGLFTIDRRPLTITTNNKQKVYGENNPVFDATYINLAYNDTIDNLVFTTTADLSTNVGVYTIQTSGGDISGRTDNYHNYIVSYNDGSLNINTAPLTISVVSGLEKIYGENDTDLSYNIVGLRDWDIMTGLLERESGEDVSSYIINRNTVDILYNPSNYDVSYNSNTYEIKTRPINIIHDDIIIETTDIIPLQLADISGDNLVNNLGINDEITDISFVSMNNTRIGDYNIIPKDAVIESSGDINTNNYDISYNYSRLTIRLKEPTDFNISDKTATTVSFTWIDNVNNDGDVDFYRVYYKATDESVWLYNDTTGDEKYITISNLRPGIRYGFRLQAIAFIDN